nr:CoA-binding protein [Nitratireductor sp.]
PSYFVLRYLMSKGFDVVAINPGHAGREIGGAKTFASLADVPHAIDMVDVFRNSEAAASVVDEALALDPLPRVIWMQLGVRNEAAAQKAEAFGVKVVMNRCPKIEYARLAGEIGWAGVNSGVVGSRKPELARGFQRYGLDKKPG